MGGTETEMAQAPAVWTNFRPSWNAEAEDRQLVEKIKEVTRRMKAHIWRQLDYDDKKAQLVGWLPEFLNNHLDPESTYKALYQLCGMKLQDITSTLEPANYHFFMYQLGIPEHDEKTSKDQSTSG